ncbi:MAG: hypothetical protein HY300_04300, partial [Verrucomicrobia bacterium]|nr:hypothetical protein [Verrucomicrobiota bacterium]
MKMPTIATAAALLALSLSAFGSAQVMIKQRAKEIARPGDPNNKGPGRATPTGT